MANKYDVAIIGGGMAGLISGLYLQKMGKRSIILEHGNQPGGNMSGIWRKGFYFDCGDQSFESFGIMFPILKDLGLYNPDEWIQIKWRFVTKDCDVPLNTYEQVRSDFKKFYPGSAAQIDEWFDYLLGLCDWYPRFVKHHSNLMTRGPMGKPFSGMNLMIAIIQKIFKIMDFSKTTASELAERIFKDEPRLKFLFGDYGYPNMPLIISSIFWYTFIYDYNYPKAGLQGYMNMLARAYVERGGEIRLKSTVNKVKNVGKIVKGVETSKGEYIAADYVINTGNPKRLVTEMLEDPTVWDFKDRQDIIRGELTLGNAAAYLGIDMSAEELKPLLKDHHTTYWRSYETVTDKYDPDLHRKGWSMISATSLFAPELAPKGKSSIVVQVYIPYGWMDDWGTHTSDPFVRTAEYKKLKERVLNDIIKDTEYIIPRLSKKIIYKELASPRSLARWTLNAEGNSMGWSLDNYSSHMAKKLGRMKTPLKNLYNAGHYSIWPGGVISAALTGRYVSRGIYMGFIRQNMK